MFKVWIFIIFVFIFLISYGIYEKDRRKQLYKDFYKDRALQCDENIIKKSDGWVIHNNRFFTNGKVFKTIVYCKSMRY